LLRRIEPLSLALVLLCLAWTSRVLVFHQSFEDAGALKRLWVWDGEYWRFLTAILLHGSWLHLILNGIALYILGSAVAHGCGRLILLLTVVLSALAGFGASLMFHKPEMLLVGISGGVLGLLGLILAVEWSVTRSVGEFLKRRNTRVVLFFLALNAVLAVVLETQMEGVKLDHAAHIAGLLFGLAAAVAYYGRGTRRPGLAALVSTLLLLPTLGYAAHPLWDARYYAHRATRAFEAGDEEAETRAWERVRVLEPESWRAGVRLALLRDDPAYLEEISLPRSWSNRGVILSAYVKLARNRFETGDLKAADAVVDALLEKFERPPVGPLRALANAAQLAGDTKTATMLYASLAEYESESSAWDAALRSLDFYGGTLRNPRLSPEMRRIRTTAAASVAFRAAGGLDRDELGDQETRTAYELDVAEFTRLVEASTRIVAGAEPPPERLGELYGWLKRIYVSLADNTRSDDRDAAYLFLSAYWWWRELEGAAGAEQREGVRNRFAAALRMGDPRVQALVEDWFRERGLPKPDVELAEQGSGG
jgi:membrane associated rhomboid family serine protease